MVLLTINAMLAKVAGPKNENFMLDSNQVFLSVSEARLNIERAIQSSTMRNPNIAHHKPH
jgi:hypothetical protein